MKLSRLFLPLLFALALLFTQQAGATHALHHALEQTQQDKKSAHSSVACEQCATYAQLGSALTTPAHSFSLAHSCDENVSHADFVFLSQHVFTANARGPPALQKIA